jgi:putative FmdB family regulatory protein
MPTYEYACKSCGEHLEVVQSFTDEPLTTCPACGGPLRKVFGSIGISFKGSGFYRNDSRSDRRRSGSGRSTTESRESGSSSESGSGSGSSAGGSSGEGAASGSTVAPAAAAG